MCVIFSGYSKFKHEKDNIGVWSCVETSGDSSHSSRIFGRSTLRHDVVFERGGATGATQLKVCCLASSVCFFNKEDSFHTGSCRMAFDTSKTSCPNG